MLHVSSSPHIRSKTTSSKIMLDVVIALMPAVIASYFIFGLRALALIAITTVACLAFEWLSRKIMGRANSLSDCSALVTGILLALNFPVGLPYWIAVLGAFFAIVLSKQIFGGLGDNFTNPAITARIILSVSFPSQMTSYLVRSDVLAPKLTTSYDLVTSATPLALLKNDPGQLPSNWQLFFGTNSGVIGEVSILALCLGAAYLLIKKVIDPVIPLSFIGSCLLFVSLTGQDPLVHLLSGGLVLGAFFMATDYVTSPITYSGKLIFGLGCGLIAGLIRSYASSYEGVSYAILLMNVLTPHINNWTWQKPLGGKDNDKK